jgi:hypothetical protein
MAPKASRGAVGDAAVLFEDAGALFDRDVDHLSANVCLRVRARHSAERTVSETKGRRGDVWGEGFQTALRRRSRK